MRFLLVVVLVAFAAYLSFVFVVNAIGSATVVADLRNKDSTPAHIITWLTQHAAPVSWPWQLSGFLFLVLIVLTGLAAIYHPGVYMRGGTRHRHDTLDSREPSRVTNDAEPASLWGPFDAQILQARIFSDGTRVLGAVVVQILNQGSRDASLGGLAVTVGVTGGATTTASLIAIAPGQEFSVPVGQTQKLTFRHEHTLLARLADRLPSGKRIEGAQAFLIPGVTDVSEVRVGTFALHFMDPSNKTYTTRDWATGAVDASVKIPFISGLPVPEDK